MILTSWKEYCQSVFTDQPDYHPLIITSAENAEPEIIPTLYVCVNEKV